VTTSRAHLHLDFHLPLIVVLVQHDHERINGVDRQLYWHLSEACDRRVALELRGA
jgi:hypothetical protein